MLTLEQLIEACGDEFLRLEKASWTRVPNWSAETTRNRHGNNEIFFGKTPTEAVQKLYDYLKENNLLNNN